MTRLFLPQTTLEEWVIEDKADMQDGRLMLAADKATFPIIPAVHFQQLVSGTDDEKLVGKVKTEAQLQTLGAESMADSVVLGDNAYEVVPGYLTEVPNLALPRTPKPPQQSSPETDLLAAFLLNKLP